MVHVTYGIDMNQKAYAGNDQVSSARKGDRGEW